MLQVYKTIRACGLHIRYSECSRLVSILLFTHVNTMPRARMHTSHWRRSNGCSRGTLSWSAAAFHGLQVSPQVRIQWCGVLRAWGPSRISLWTDPSSVQNLAHCTAKVRRYSSLFQVKSKTWRECHCVWVRLQRSHRKVSRLSVVYRDRSCDSTVMDTTTTMIQ